jgi:hypothetical protein
MDKTVFYRNRVIGAADEPKGQKGQVIINELVINELVNEEQLMIINESLTN